MFKRKGRLEKLMRFLYLVDTKRDEEVEGRLDVNGPRENIPGIVQNHVLLDMDEHYPLFSIMRDIAEECGLIGVKRYYTIKTKTERSLLVADKSGNDILDHYCGIQRLFGMDPLMRKNTVNAAALEPAPEAASYATPEAGIMFGDLSGRRSRMELCMDILTMIKKAESEGILAGRYYLISRAGLSGQELAKMTEYMAGEDRKLLSTYGFGRHMRYRLEENGREALSRMGSIVGVIGADRLARMYSKKSRKA